MNQELKLKWHSIYGQILFERKLHEAWLQVKENKGAGGIDGETIESYEKKLDENLGELLRKLRDKAYVPSPVRRRYIPKKNGKMRPLGIPNIEDRIVQQAMVNVLQPKCEEHIFHRWSCGYRPNYGAKRVAQIILWNIETDHNFIYDCDIEIFDNVNHSLLIKQLWNMGIQDKRVLACISKMLKAEIDGEGIPSKGVPQGGLLSPLLSNIVLNELDQWIAGQWELFPMNEHYETRSGELYAKKRSNLKEGYIVRYADDFKVLCRDWRTAQKWYHAVRLFLKERLKLDISPEKSQIVNLRKRESEFLGFTIRANRKGNKRVAHTGIKAKNKRKIKEEAKARILKLRASPTAQNALLFNSFVLGIHNYFKWATHVNPEFSRLAYELRAFMFNRLKQIGKYEHPENPPPTYKKFYSRGFRTFKLANVYLYPIADVKTSNTMNFSQGLTPYTVEGRDRIHKKLRPDIGRELVKLMESNLPNRSVEYMDNRMSRYSMKMGKCEVTGVYLFANDVHCHHYVPLHLGGSDKFSNLRILHKDVHRLIHSTLKETIDVLMSKIGITEPMGKLINQYRSNFGLEPI